MGKGTWSKLRNIKQTTNNIKIINGKERKLMTQINN